MGHRSELLAAARRLLESKGYAHITARDLVAESGTNLASIGYHFGSKAELLNEAIGTVLADWCEQLASLAMADEAASPIERAFTTWTAMRESLPAKRDLLLSYVEAVAQAERSDVLRAQFAEHYRAVRTRVAGFVGESLNVAPEDPRCAALAGFVIAMCDGLALQWLIDPDGVSADDDLRDGLIAAWAAAAVDQPAADQPAAE